MQVVGQDHPGVDMKRRSRRVTRTASRNAWTCRTILPLFPSRGKIPVNIPSIQAAHKFQCVAMRSDP